MGATNAIIAAAEHLSKEGMILTEATQPKRRLTRTDIRLHFLSLATASCKVLVHFR